MEETTKKQRGGYREGGGRKPGINQVSRTYKIDKKNDEYLKGIKNKNGLINRLIKGYRERAQGIIEINH